MGIRVRKACKPYDEALVPGKCLVGASESDPSINNLIKQTCTVKVMGNESMNALIQQKGICAVQGQTQSVFIPGSIVLTSAIRVLHSRSARVK